jgi:hypothetical protein
MSLREYEMNTLAFGSAFPAVSALATMEVFPDCASHSKLRTSLEWWPGNVGSGHEPPRRLAAGAAEVPPKAAAPVVRQWGVRVTDLHFEA